MKRGIALTVALAASFFLAGCDQGKKQDNGTVFRVGVIADRTGFMSGHGRSIELGARLAADELNSKGGIAGKKVELVVLDGASDPAQTANRARELLQGDKVDLLIGTGSSAATLAAIGPATESKVPFIYSLDGEIKTCAPRLPNELNRYIFASGFSERMAVRPLLEFLMKKVGKDPRQTSVFFVGGDYVYPRTTNAYAVSIARSLGMNVVGDEYSDTSTPDYSPVIRRILATHPDILIVTNPGASGVTFMRQAQQFSLQEKMLISGFATFDQEAIDSMGTASEGVYVINRYSMHLPGQLNIAFTGKFHTTYSNYPLLPGPTAAAGAYGSLIAVAYAAAASHDTSPEGLIKGLEGLKLDLPQGEVEISPRNHMFDQPLYIMQIHNQQYGVVANVPRSGHPGFEACSVK